MAAPSKALTLVEIDLADAEFIVREHPDGLFTIDMSEERLVVNAEHLKVIIGSLLRLGKEKGWV